MERVITYVDGFNFYFGLRSKNWKKYYWLDFPALSASILKPNQQFLHCHYFTARIREAGNKSQNVKRQVVWLDALNTLDNLSIHYGHYLSRKVVCKKCGNNWTKFEEKMTDVNIATQLLVDAYENHFDMAIVFSGDSDLSAPIRLLQKRFPEKSVVVAFPPGRTSFELKKVGSASFMIGEGRLRKNLMPNSVTTADGYQLTRPEQWY